MPINYLIIIKYITVQWIVILAKIHFISIHQIIELGLDLWLFHQQAIVSIRQSVEFDQLTSLITGQLAKCIQKTMSDGRFANIGFQVNSKNSKLFMQELNMWTLYLGWIMRRGWRVRFIALTYKIYLLKLLIFYDFQKTNLDTNEFLKCWSRWMWKEEYIQSHIQGKYIQVKLSSEVRSHTVKQLKW